MVIPKESGEFNGWTSYPLSKTKEDNGANYSSITMITPAELQIR